jgi:hypothetical protein
LQAEAFTSAFSLAERRRMQTNENSNGNGTSSPDWEWESDFRDHFLYFPERFNADVAAERLLAKGWKVQVTRIASREDWLVFATDPAPNNEEFEILRQELESLARELGGDYDGWGGPG